MIYTLYRHKVSGMELKKRTTEEYIVLSISGSSAVCIFPFLVIRALDGDWALALLDLFAVLSTAILFGYVYITRKVKGARLFQAFLCVAVVVGTIVLKGTPQVVWIYPGLIGLFFLLKPKLALAFSLCLISGIGLFLSQKLELLALIQYLLSTMITVLFSYAFSDRMLRQQNLLRELSVQDPLTGAGNRRALEEKLLAITEHPPAPNTPMPALILIDLDEFKKVNDQFGHGVGDIILREFSFIVNKIISGKECFYRFGGEEFVIVCSQLTTEQASVLAEDIREAIDNHVFDGDLKVTISLGIAEYKTEETGFEWLERADKAMYKAKDAGRNLCCIAA